MPYPLKIFTNLGGVTGITENCVENVPSEHLCYLVNPCVFEHFFLNTSLGAEADGGYGSSNYKIQYVFTHISQNYHFKIPQSNPLILGSNANYFDFSQPNIIKYPGEYFIFVNIYRCSDGVLVRSLGHCNNLPYNE